MDRRERFESPESALLAALTGWQRDIWTALPATIESFDPITETCTAQPALQLPVLQQDGTTKNVTLPMLLDVPVIFPGGGGYTLTFPISQGDEALIVFASRCIDAWWQQGGAQIPPLYRMHNLSDGFAIVGPRSQPRKLANVSTISTQVRSDDGATVIDLKNANVTITAANVLVNSTSSTINAVATIVNSSTAAINSTVSATVSAPSIILKNAGTALKSLLNSAFATWASTHVHSNGNAGANTGAPTTTPAANTQTSVVQAE